MILQNNLTRSLLRQVLRTALYVRYNINGQCPKPPENSRAVIWIRNGEITP